MIFMKEKMYMYIRYSDYLIKENQTPCINDLTYVYDSVDNSYVLDIVSEFDIRQYDLEGIDYFHMCFIKVPDSYLENLSSVEKRASVSFVTWLSENMINYMSSDVKIDFNYLYDIYEKEKKK